MPRVNSETVLLRVAEKYEADEEAAARAKGTFVALLVWLLRGLTSVYTAVFGSMEDRDNRAESGRSEDTDSTVDLDEFVRMNATTSPQVLVDTPRPARRKTNLRKRRSAKFGESSAKKSRVTFSDEIGTSDNPILVSDSDIPPVGGMHPNDPNKEEAEKKFLEKSAHLMTGLLQKIHEHEATEHGQQLMSRLEGVKVTDPKGRSQSVYVQCEWSSASDDERVWNEKRVAKQAAKAVRTRRKEAYPTAYGRNKDDPDTPRPKQGVVRCVVPCTVHKLILSDSEGEDGK